MNSDINSISTLDRILKIGENDIKRCERKGIETGKLNIPADRDHCLQYMIAIGLLHGDLIAEHYEDDVASDPRVDKLREKMTIKEDKRYTEEYLEADKRSIANKIQINVLLHEYELKFSKAASKIISEYTNIGRLDTRSCSHKNFDVRLARCSKNPYICCLCSLNALF